jgi:hypothetical protein
MYNASKIKIFNTLTVREDLPVYIADLDKYQNVIDEKRSKNLSKSKKITRKSCKGEVLEDISRRSKHKGKFTDCLVLKKTRVKIIPSYLGD